MTLNGHHIRAPETGEPALDGTLAESLDVKVEAFVGDTLLTIGDLNRVKDGDIVPLSTTLTDPIELRVNGVPVARGELVAVGDRFAVRIIEIV